MTRAQVLARLVNEMVAPEAARRDLPIKAIPSPLVAELAEQIVRGRCTWGIARTLIEGLGEIAAC